MESGHEMLDHAGSPLSFPTKESTLVPALEPYLIEPIFAQFKALLPDREVDHPLGCHRPRIPDRVVFEKLVQVLVFGCAYRRIADEGCSATTLRDRRNEWIEIGAMDSLREIVLEAYDRYIGLELSEVAVDCCITKAPCGGQKAGRSPVDRGKRGIKRSTAVDGEGIPLGGVTAPANCHDSELTHERLEERGLLAEISRKGKPAPLGATKRWVVERTSSWHNAHKKLVWCTEKRGQVVDFWVAFSEVVIIVRRLIREGWSRYRWKGRPSR